MSHTKKTFLGSSCGVKSIIFSWRCPLFSSRQEGKGNRFSHRRRKNIEDTAKVVSDVRGTEFIQYLVALGRIAWTRPFLQIILLQFILFFKSPLCYICSVAWNGMNFFRPPNSSDDLCLLFCLFLLLWLSLYYRTYIVLYDPFPPLFTLWWSLLFNLRPDLGNIFLF